ncbi:uncharacterized protein [Ptychodera flava]|uniref:uncharacterized protein n=1 Tax=Ptychodera flava TaxID=63121 RepID=UPI00396A0E30
MHVISALMLMVFNAATFIVDAEDAIVPKNRRNLKDIDNTRSERMPVDFTKGAEKDNLELSTDGDIPLVKTIGQPDAKSGRNSVKGESDSAENKTLELTTNGDIPKVKTIGQPDAKSVKNSAKGESVSEFTDLERTGLTSGDLVHEAEKKTLELSTDGDIPLVKTKGQPDAKSGRHFVKGESDSDMAAKIFVVVGITISVQVGMLLILLMIRKRRKESGKQRTEVQQSTREDQTPI